MVRKPQVNSCPKCGGDKKTYANQCFNCRYPKRSILPIPEDTDTRLIDLGQGRSTLVDAEDFEYLNSFRWWIRSDYNPRYKYAVAHIDGVVVQMHRKLLGLQSGDDRVGDHVNGNTLDNRKRNLRIATRSQNCANSKVSKRSMTGLKGVNRNRYGRFQAYISGKGGTRNLGMFATAEEAHEAYKKAAIEKYGEFFHVE